MEESNYSDFATVKELDWDTGYFGVTCGKVILHKSLNENIWYDLLRQFDKYKFITIDNQNSNPINAHFIGTTTKAFLADVNIQFIKQPTFSDLKRHNIQIFNAMEPNFEVVEIADFQYSRFFDDQELLNMGGAEIYRHWVRSSFLKSDKYFAIAYGPNNKIEGFLLFSYSNRICVIELIAVNKEYAKSGLGTSLIKAIEYEAYHEGCTLIKVGTQLRNVVAINFYNKVGYKQTACHQIYHLWNKN